MSCLVAYFAYVLVNHYHLAQSDNYINDAFEIKNAGFLNALYYGLVRSIFYLRGSIEYNPVLWTMAIEFYGSLALFIAYKQKHPLRVMFIIAILFMAINTTVFLGIFSFYIGMLIKEKFSEYKNNAVSLLLIILGLYFAGIHTSSLSYSYIANLAGKHSYDIFNFLSGVLIVLGVMSNTAIQRFLSHSFLVWFGSLSFPLYLIHWATIYVFSNLFYLYDFENSLINSAAIIILSIIIASIFVKVDTISIKLSKKIKQ
ncbi:acyltransferase family protein [Providencia sp. R33]|nr:acyltransferase family protein [Providencia sp. R33]ELR5149590.1 acyltransferase family protein [Providencia rettgeri]QXX83386.1 acyltransferase family protein [Providencia sp. R33]